MKPKTVRVIFWVTTIFIFLFEGVMPLLTSQTELAKEGIRHLGFPSYFGLQLVIFKVLGALAIIIPQTPARIKEWAYFGLALVSISAFIGHFVIDGFGFMTIFPLVIFVIICISYTFYHVLRLR